MENPPTKVFSVNMQFNPLLGEGCNSWDVWTRQWALLSVHLRGLFPPPPVFKAPGEGDKVPPWSVPPMEVPYISVGRPLIATCGHTVCPGEGS